MWSLFWLRERSLTDSRGETIPRGGLTHNAERFEIIQEKNGEVMSINERSVANDVVNPRGTESRNPSKATHTCRDCNKTFKRPCDLTKHEKTHCRPWKCTEESCKYFELGWPTEKERDRHVHDKHTFPQPQFKCLYPPCAYASKRESNCKHHMECAHGWKYVRSKRDGQKMATSSSIDRTSGTPVSVFSEPPSTASTKFDPNFNLFSRRDPNSNLFSPEDPNTNVFPLLDFGSDRDLPEAGNSDYYSDGGAAKEETQISPQPETNSQAKTEMSRHSHTDASDMDRGRPNYRNQEEAYSPTPEVPVTHTRTGRISKAKKGEKVHKCDVCNKVSRLHPLCVKFGFEKPSYRNNRILYRD